MDTSISHMGINTEKQTYHQTEPNSKINQRFVKMT